MHVGAESYAGTLCSYSSHPFLCALDGVHVGAKSYAGTLCSYSSRPFLCALDGVHVGAENYAGTLYMYLVCLPITCEHEVKRSVI